MLHIFSFKTYFYINHQMHQLRLSCSVVLVLKVMDLVFFVNQSDTLPPPKHIFFHTCSMTKANVQIKGPKYDISTTALRAVGMF